MAPTTEKGEVVKSSELSPFCLDSILTGYLPVPRELLDMELPGTAILLYAVLLDRATLSRKNRFADEHGHVYVVYPIEKLAQALSLSETSVKRSLKTLARRGLIRRERPRKNGPSHIYLNLPAGSIKAGDTVQKRPLHRAETDGWTVQKRPVNNRRKPLDLSDYYEREDDESL